MFPNYYHLDLNPGVRKVETKFVPVASHVAAVEHLQTSSSTSVALEVFISTRKLSSTQKILFIRICIAYKIISTEGLRIIVGVPPIELLIK